MNLRRSTLYEGNVHAHTVTCSICGAENDSFATLCSKCRSFIQAKVDTLNLFAMIWLMIESPSEAFRKVILAQHKNYVVGLTMVTGVAITYQGFWFLNWGDSSSNLFTILTAGAFVGPFLGLLMFLIAAVIIHLFQPSTKLKNSFAVVAYASIPIVLMFVLVFPAEIAVFGLYFFGTNPPPSALQPFAYYSLRIISGIAALWCLDLLILGVLVLKNTTWGRSILIGGVVVAVLGTALAGLKFI